MHPDRQAIIFDFDYTLADPSRGTVACVPVEAGTPVELCIRRPNADSPVHTEMRVTEIRWHGDNVFLATLRDITTRKAAERKLQYHADILRNVHDAIIVTDGEGVITYWNEGGHSYIRLHRAGSGGRNLGPVAS